MKDQEASEKVLKAISIGLAAFIASSSPMTVLAQSDENHDQDTGSMTTDADNNAKNTASVEQRRDTEMLSVQGESQQETTSPVYPAGTDESHMAEHVNNKAEEFNNVETSGAESVEAMQKTEADAEEADRKAKEEAETAQDHVDELTGTEGLIDQINEEAGKAQDAAQDARDASESAWNAAQDAQTAVSNAEDALNNTSDGLIKTHDDYNTATDHNQKQADSSIEEAKDVQKKITEQAQEASDQAKLAKEQALDSLDQALNVVKDNTSGAELTPEQKRDILSAVQDVQNAAETARKAVNSAQDAVNLANNQRQDLISEYNRMAMIYGLPLYQDLQRDDDGNIQYDEAGNPMGSITYTEDQIESAGCKEQHDQIKELKESHADKADIIISTAIDSRIQDVQNAENTFTAAQEAYDTAADHYQEALNSANEAFHVAKEAADRAEDYADRAEDYAEDTLNYYVNKAQDESDAAKQAVIEKEQELSDAKLEETEKQSVYEEVKKQAVEEAEKRYTADVNDAKYAFSIAESVEGEKRFQYDLAKYAYDTAEENYKKYRKNHWPWEWTGSDEYKAFTTARKAYLDAENALNQSKKAKQEAYQAYSALNTQSSKDRYVNLAIEESKKTEEYQSFIEAQDKVVTLSDEKIALEADFAVKSDELANRQKEVEEIRATYLKELEDTQAELRDDLIRQVNDSIIDKSNIINQVEFDKALYAWAQDWTQYMCEHGEAHTIGGYTYWFDHYGDDDAEVIREQLNSKYPVSGDSWWNSLWNHIKDYVDDTKVLEVMVSGSSHQEVMENWIQVYRESLQGLEEQKAIMESQIAALDAKAAAQDALNAVASVTDDNGSLKVEKLVDKKTAADIEDAKKRVAEAKTTLDDIKEQAKEYTTLNRIDLTKLLNQIASAEHAVKEAEVNLAEAEKDKDAAVRYAAYASHYGEYAKDSDQLLQKATGFVQITKDEDGNIIYHSSNEEQFDLEDSKVISRPESYFTAMSDYQSITVPESIYRTYLKAIVKYEKNDGKSGIADRAGAGIALNTGKNDEKDRNLILYWELNAENKMTGRYFTSTNELTDGGRYFIAYSFKKEGDMNQKGYHMDGYLFTYSAPETEKTQEDGGTGDGGTGDQRTRQLDTVTIVPEITPLAYTVETEPFTTIQDEIVPLESAPDTNVTIEDDNVALSESVPQTGDNSIPTAPIATTGILAVMASFLLKLFKKDRR